jgi:hypothetical protein
VEDSVAAADPVATAPGSDLLLVAGGMPALPASALAMFEESSFTVHPQTALFSRLRDDHKADDGTFFGKVRLWW